MLSVLHLFILGDVLQFDFSLIEGHWHFPQFLDIIIKAAINIYIQVLCDHRLSFLWDKCPRVKIDRLYIFSLRRICQMALEYDYFRFSIGITTILNFTHFDRCIATSHCGFNEHSPND